MSDPGPDLIRAVRAGCDYHVPRVRCHFPQCDCALIPGQVEAALAELLTPSVAMLDAGRAATAHWTDLPLQGVALEREKFRIRWRAIMRCVLGTGGDHDG